MSASTYFGDFDPITGTIPLNVDPSVSVILKRARKLLLGVTKEKMSRLLTFVEGMSRQRIKQPGDQDKNAEPWYGYEDPYSKMFRTCCEVPLDDAKPHEAFAILGLWQIAELIRTPAGSNSLVRKAVWAADAISFAEQIFTLRNSADEIEEALERKSSSISVLYGKKRHQRTERIKKEIFADYDQRRHLFPSVKKFSENLMNENKSNKTYPKLRTVEGWLNERNKSYPQ